MKAIETTFHGYKFRSRLEARWAVFFTSLGLKWEYEPEGFDLPGGYRYLPDFKVLYPGSGWEWFEVKADLDRVTEVEWGKITAFARQTGLTLLDGVPDLRTYLTVDQLFNPGELRLDAPWQEPKGTPISDMLRIARYPDRFGVVLWSHKKRLWWDEHSNVFRHLEDSTIVDAVFDLVRAVDAARSARFEFGVKGRA